MAALEIAINSKYYDCLGSETPGQLHRFVGILHQQPGIEI